MRTIGALLVIALRALADMLERLAETPESAEAAGWKHYRSTTNGHVVGATLEIESKE